MKRYLLIISFAIILLAGCMPSEEMLNLRDIESSLDLPDPVRRSEKGKGCYTDGKGAQQYDMYIFIIYDDKEKIDTVLDHIERNGWTLRKTVDYEEFTSVIHYYIHDAYEAEISVLIDGDDDNSMFIKSNRTREYCNH